MRYAVDRWGGRARSLLGEILQSRLESGSLDEDDVTLLSEMTPTTPTQRQHVLQVAADSSLSFNLQWAALQALGRSPDVESDLLQSWLKLIEDEQTDGTLRSGALDAMAELGSRAFEAQPRLLAMLPHVSDESILGSLARTLVAIAPASAPVTSVLSQRLKQTDVDSPLFVDLVEACRGMGPAASICQAEFLRGFTHNDELTRTRCIEAIHQIGSSDPKAAEALVARILDPDEVVGIKSLAAETLAGMGLVGQQSLAAHLTQTVDATAKTNLLRALAIVGGQYEVVGPGCLTALNDAQADLELRVAAASALGFIRPATPVSVQALDALCNGNHPEQLRSAALLALAHLDSATAMRHVDAFHTEASILLRASSAYTHHLAGDSRQAFDELVALIDGSETDEIMSRCLADMGSIIQPWLVEVASDHRALQSAREICFSLACDVANPDWAKLLPLVDDPEVGSQFVIIAEGKCKATKGSRLS